MDKESEGLDLLEKHVFEEDKIVTYKWLSRHLNVHVNIAKRLLAKFVDKTSDKLGVTYVIGGVLPDGSHKFVVDWYDNISDTEHEFKTVTSKHVYSVQKNVTNGDLKTVLFINDTCEIKDKENKMGCSSIKCEDSIVKNGSAMMELRQKALTAAKSKSVAVNDKKSVPDSKKQTNGLEKNGASKLSDSKSNADSSNVKSASASPKKSGIAAMFAAQKDTKKPENKVQNKPSKPPVKSKGLAAFFNQQNTNKSSEKVNENKNKEKLKNDSPKNGIDTSDSASKENSESTETDIKTKSDDKDKSDKCNNSKTSSNKSKSKKSDNKRKKGRKDEDSMKKKRKRIVQISDSESSDEEKYERSPSPEQREPTPPPPVIENDDLVHTSENGGKYKKKKLVEKTFLDADGFLVTSKEYEFVSASEDEDEKIKNTDKQKEEIKKPAEAKVKEVKKTSPVKVKQASIMNFFGKK